MSVIEIKDLHKSFGPTKIYNGLNLTVEKGDVISVIGASGCGKSVFLRCIEMLEKPDSGQIFINGEEITAKGANIGKIRRSLGMVYQDFGLFSNMNVMQNLCIAPMKLLKMPKAEAEKKALDLLATVGLADKANRPVQVLSGGQKQRVAICRTMMMDPSIVLFDEPTSALDPTMVGEVLATIRMLSTKGLTMIIVTHEMNFAKQIANRVLFFADGGIYEEGTPEDIFDNPQKEKTIDFIRKLKHKTYEINSRNFDLMALQGGIQEFSTKYGLDSKQCYQLQICTEEMVYILLDHIGDNEVNITVTISFSEADHACQLEFTSVDSSYDPVVDMSDEDAMEQIGLMIIKNKSKEYLHTYNDGVNKITLKL